jgi:hypothetical protein
MAQVMKLRVGILNRLCCASLRLFVHFEAAFHCKPPCTFVLTGSMIDYFIQFRDDDEHRALSRCIVSLLSYRETSKQDLPEIDDDQRELLRSYLQPSVLRSVMPPEDSIHMVVTGAVPNDLVLNLLRMCHRKPVPQLLFDRLTRDRQLWGEDGELKSLELSLPEPRFQFYRNEGNINRAIEILCSTNTIRAVPASMNKRAYEVSDASIDYNSSLSREYVLQLVSHAFPGHHDEIGLVQYC